MMRNFADTTALLVFADDWGRHPSSAQHLFQRLSKRHSIIWVNTIGTRTPRFDLATLRRGLDKIRHWTRRTPNTHPLPRNVRVLNPVMSPWFGSPLARGLNRRLLLRQILPAIESLRVPAMAVTSIPLVADLMGALPVSRWVYYCVDDFSQWPGLDQPTLREMERLLVRRADRLVAVSETLQSKLAGMGRAASLLTHGVDLDHWSNASDEIDLPQIDALPRPLVVFWGVIDRRMDVEFVHRLARDMDRGTIALVGPESDPDPRLFQSPRIARVAPIAFEQLPAVARRADVLVMPYADIPVTRAIQPLKLTEYLATGRPAVVRDLPAVRPWADCLDLAGTAESFSAAVRFRIEHGLPQQQRVARRRLAHEDWDTKAAQFEQLLLGRSSWRVAS